VCDLHIQQPGSSLTASDGWMEVVDVRPTGKRSGVVVHTYEPRSRDPIDVA
jgi:hypothetical protein